MIHGAGTAAIDVALDPLKKGLGFSPSAAEVHAAEIEAGRAVDRLVLEQCVVHLRAEDLQAIYNDPR